MNIDNSWNLVGSPMASKSDVTLGSNITLFGFSGTYKSESEITPQTGYWAKSRSGSQITFSGDENTSATIALQEGWNIIGGITDTVDVSNINDPGGIRSSTPVQEYIGGAYQTASNIKPTQGYWIYANQAGNIEISSSGSSSKQPLSGISSTVDQIEFNSGTASQLFFLSPQSLDKVAHNQFRMPPMAPEPILDIRTGNGFRIVEGKRTQLELTTSSYPITVSVPQNLNTHYVLKGVTNRDTVYYDFNGDTEVSIQHPSQKFFLDQVSADELITENSLLPNYPNPFNPSTTIRYQVASQANVKLDVYDVLGRKIRTLVNRQQQRGSYSIQFDGRNLSSGTYFIHLKAGQTTKIQKMTLIK
jgi:hypothetical protein